MNIFSCTYCPLVYSWRNVYSGFLPLFKLFLLLSCRNSLYILDTNFLSYDLQIFSPILLIFHSVDRQHFKFCSSPNYLLFLLLSYLESFAKSEIMKISPMFSSKRLLVLVLIFRSSVHFKIHFSRQHQVQGFCFTHVHFPGPLLRKLFFCLLIGGEGCVCVCIAQ